MSPSEKRLSRLRLNEESAQLVEALLRVARRQTLKERRRAINADEEPQVTEANRQLKLIDFVLEEVEQTQFENDWHSADGRMYAP